MSARATKAERRYWTADDIEALLVARYTGREYAYLSQVRNATGYSRRARTADAIVMSTWPSRGLLLMGFEIKVRRDDWIRELKDPEKADDICGFCDRWWIVAPDINVVRPDELPEAWGLQVATEKGDSLRTVKEPTGSATKAITREFLASMLRNAGEAMVPRSDVQPRIDAATKASLEQGKRDAKHELGKWAHMGRVNTARRIHYAAVTGCDSVDGSGFSKWSREMIRRHGRLLRDLSEQRRLTLDTLFKEDRTP